MKDLVENEKKAGLKREREILLYRMTIQDGEEDLRKLKNTRKYFKTLNFNQ